MRKNNSDRFNAADYVNFISNISSDPSDVAIAFSEIFFPVFELIDGTPFNVSFGCYYRFLKNIEEGISRTESYYWSHVTDVEGLFGVDRRTAENIAENMCIGWNRVLLKERVDHIAFRKSVGDDVVLEPVIDTKRFVEWN